MSTAHFSNGTELHDLFMPANCHAGGGCWHDRDEDCPVLLSIITDHQHPDVTTAKTGLARCSRFMPMAEGRRRERENEKQRDDDARLSAHGGGLFTTPEDNHDDFDF